MIKLKSKAEIEKMAAAGAVVASVLNVMEHEIGVGVTTQHLDELAEQTIREAGGIPTFKGYRGFPASICSSPNAMVVHGVPGEFEVGDGDILSVDVGVTLDGFVGDSAWTFAVGAIPEETNALLNTCEKALMAGIEQARPGNHIGDISAAVQKVTEDAGFAVIRSLVGHGVGEKMHEDPQVPNFGTAGAGPVLQEGMTIAIEPMITVGTHEIVLADDEWSISSADGSMSAHFEHTVAVTADAPRVLTRRNVPEPAVAVNSLLG
jgi:methionyl aminopeptidase